MKNRALALILTLILALGAFAQDTPELVTPTYGQHFVPTTGTLFIWIPKPGYHNWVLQVADNPALDNPLIEVQVTTTRYRFPGTLPAGTRLYWRVFYINDEGQRYHSGLGTFWTAPAIHYIEMLR
ncbi:MAG: hypothetical protein Q8O14_14730 [bacterium]|nr:hypothetical protein [bacterium]